MRNREKRIMTKEEVIDYIADVITRTTNKSHNKDEVKKRLNEFDRSTLEAIVAVDGKYNIEVMSSLEEEVRDALSEQE